MDLRQLRYYIVVAEELHFGRAAERLKMTQPALSKQIMVLEKDIGVQLLTRTKRVVQLTHAGQAFLERARTLIAQAEETIQVTRRTARGEEGELRIGASAPALQSVLPDLLRSFRKRFPKVELNLSSLSVESQVLALNQRQIDIGFLHPPIDGRGLDLYPVSEEDYVAILPKNHRLLKYDRIPLAQFAGESFLILPRHESPVIYDQFVQFCQKLGFQPNIVKEVLDFQTRLCLIASGVGISFTAEGMQASVGPNVVCKPLEYCPIKQKTAVAWRQDATAPAIQSFLELIRSQFPKSTFPSPLVNQIE
jgi:DNA-binding transcriptional LysR family regulator